MSLVPAVQPPGVSITTAQHRPATVTGRLDDAGLALRREMLTRLLDTGSRFVECDLTQVTAGAGCAWSGWARRCSTRSPGQRCSVYRAAEW